MLNRDASLEASSHEIERLAKLTEVQAAAAHVRYSSGGQCGSLQHSMLAFMLSTSAASDTSRADMSVDEDQLAACHRLLQLRLFKSSQSSL